MRPAPRVLFLCTGNSCRSQMAEGWARHRWGDRLEAFSAGLQAHGLDPLAAKVMAEVGVSIESQRSKTLEELGAIEPELVVTVCGHADEQCPRFPGKTRVIHAPFDDPPRLAERARDEEEALRHYRRVRDEIGEFIEKLPRLLEAESPTRKESSKS